MADKNQSIGSSEHLCFLFEGESEVAGVAWGKDEKEATEVFKERMCEQLDIDEDTAETLLDNVDCILVEYPSALIFGNGRLIKEV